MTSITPHPPTPDETRRELRELAPKTRGYHQRRVMLQAAEHISALLQALQPAERPESAERTLESIAAMLGWMNVPPRETLEADIRALKARAQAAPPSGSAPERACTCGMNPSIRDWHLPHCAIRQGQPAPAPAGDGAAVLMAIGAFCHHKRGCPAIGDDPRCSCGLLEAQMAVAALAASATVATPAELSEAQTEDVLDRYPHGAFRDRLERKLRAVPSVPPAGGEARTIEHAFRSGWAAHRDAQTESGPCQEEDDAWREFASVPTPEAGARQP